MSMIKGFLAGCALLNVLAFFGLLITNNTVTLLATVNVFMASICYGLSIAVDE